MKKAAAIILAAILASACFTGCSNGSIEAPESSSPSSKTVDSPSSGGVVDESSVNPENSTNSEESNNDGESVDGNFTWKGNRINGLSDEGVKQTSLNVPTNCTGFSYIDTEEYSNMGDFAIFKYSDVLENVAFENDDTELKKFLFSYCKSLKTVELPKKLETIPVACFQYCSSLESIDIPASVTAIEDAAFQSCTSLKSVKIPDGVKKIAGNAFSDCTALEEVYIPESVTAVNMDAFIMSNDKHDYEGKITIYVKKGSYADKNFDDYSYYYMTKAYY